MTIKLEISPYSDPCYLSLVANFLNQLASMNRCKLTEPDCNKTDQPESKPDLPQDFEPKFIDSDGVEVTGLVSANKLYNFTPEELAEMEKEKLPECKLYVPTPEQIAKHLKQETADDAFGDVKIEVDSAGLPWDGRIHSRDKGKLKNGKWRIKKNIDRSIIANVEAELRNRMSNTEYLPQSAKNTKYAVVESGTVETSESDLTPPLKVHHMQFNGLGTPAAPSAPKSPPPPPPPAIAAQDDPFDTLMVIVEDAIKSNKITTKQVQDIVMGVPGAINMSNLAKKQEFVPPVQDAIVKAIAGK